MDPAVRARIEAACAKGGSSIHSTGSSPGFITEAVPIVLASIQRSVNAISIAEFADCSSRDSPAMIFEIMGFGQKPGGSPEADQARYDYLRDAFGPSLHHLADALGLTIDTFEASGGVGTARADTMIAAGVVPAGTVAAQRTRISGMHDGKPIISFTATWYVSSRRRHQRRRSLGLSRIGLASADRRRLPARCRRSASRSRRKIMPR